MASKQWTAEDIEKIWNSTGSGAQTNTAPLPTLNNTSKKANTSSTYKIKPYENKQYTAEDIEKVWKNVERGKQVQSEMKTKANSAPAKHRTVPTKEQAEHEKINERVNEMAKETEKNLRAQDMANISRKLGDNNATRYNSRFSLDKPTQKDAGQKLSQLSYTRALERQERAKKNAERTAEANAHRENDRQRIENEVKAIQAKGDMASQEELDRYDELLKTAEKRGFIEHDSPYLVSRERYNKLAQNSNLEGDLEPLAMALTTDAATRGRGVRAIEGMGYNSVDDYVDQLSKRYELTPDEVKDVVKTFQSNKTRGQERQAAIKMYDYGQKHPVAGGVLSALASPASGVEGYYNVGANMLTGDDRNQSNLLSNITEYSKQGGAEHYDSKAAQNAYNFIVGGAGMALNARGGGLPAIASMSGNTANEAMNMAIERGVAPEQAAAYGALAGGADTVFNAIGFNAIEDRLKAETVTGVKDVLKNLGAGALTEAGENVAQDITQTVADEIINGQNSEIRKTFEDYVFSGMTKEDAFKQTAVDYATQLRDSAATGAIGGAVFSGMGMAGKDVALPVLNKAAGKAIDWKTARDSQKASDLRARLLSNEAEVPTMDESNRIGAEPITEAQSAPIEAPSLLTKNTNSVDDVANTVKNEPVNPVNNTIIDTKELSKIQFANDADRAEFNNAWSEFERANAEFEDALVNAEDEADIIDAITRIDDTYRNMKNTASMGTVTDKSGQNSLRDIKKNFKANTKGMVINLPTEMRNEMGFKDMTMRQINSKMSSLGGNDYIKFSAKGGTPIDEVWDELVRASGNQLSPNVANSADMAASLIDYVDSLKVDGRGIEQIEANIDSIIPDEYWDDIAKRAEEAGRRLENEGKVIAEDIGINPKTDIEEGYTIESEPIQRDTYKEPGVSEFATNTATGAGVVNKEILDNDPILRKAAEIEHHSNARTFSDAMEVVNTRGDEWYDEVVNGKHLLGQPREVDGKMEYEKADQDFDTGMIILQNLADQISMTNDPIVKQALVAKRNALFAKMRIFSSNAARTLQAHAKWTDTADGAILNGDKIRGEQTRIWATRNVSKVKGNKRLAEALKKQGYDGSMDNITKEPPTLDELRSQVRKTLESEFASVEDQFSDDDVSYLAGLISQNATVAELTEALNAKMATGAFGLSAETQSRVNDIFKAMDMVNPESKEYADMQLEAFRLIADEVNPKASALEKFDSWRYLAMLGNPKTMIRNWLGNQMFNVVTGISNNVAALGEEMADRRSIRKTGHGLEKRTKALINPFDRSAIKAARNDFNLMRYQSGAGTKYKDTKSAIQDASSTFDSRFVKFYEELVNKGISDTSAVRRKYATSLLGYMKANGLSEADMDASQKYEALNRLSRRKLLSNSEKAELDSLRETHNKMEKARDYALKEAEYATFHEDNKFADWLSQAANSNDVAKIFIDGMVPFKKTPANVLRSGLEYSPLGITKSGYLMIKRAVEMKGDYADTYETKKLLGKGTKEVQRTYANDVIDSWSKSLTGSGLAALGYLLFSKGILQSGSEDEKYQNDLEGLQNFSIKFNVGGKDHTYTIDWAAPAVMPLLLGAEVKKIMDEQAIPGNEMNPDDIVRIINSTLNPIMETSMLQGVQNTLETVARQASSANGVGEFAGGVLGSLATNLATGYVTQGIPTLSGQLARTIDGTRRTTDTKSTSSIMSEAEKQLRKTANKIPFASRLNTPYIDARGETQSNNPFEYSERFLDEPLKNVAKAIPNLLYQSLSPGYLAEVDTRASDQIARDAYNGLDENGKPIKDADVFANWKSQVKINGQKLNPDQMYNYRVASGQANTQIREKLATEDWFNNLSADRQTEILKNTNSLVDHIGKAAADPTYSTESSAYEAYEKNGIDGVIEFYRESAHNNDIKSELGSTADFQKQLYDSGNEARMAKYKEGLSVAQQIMPDKTSLTEEQFLKYEKYGADALKKELNYAKKADELGVSNGKTFQTLVSKGVSDAQIKTAYDAITSTKTGQDEYGRDQYMSFNEDSYNLYQKYGSAGLKEYQEMKKQNVSYETWQQAHKAIPTLSKSSYVKMFKAMDGKTGSKPDGTISQKELLYLFNKNNYSESQAKAYWNAFGKISGEDAWKSVPELKYNKKTNKMEWKAVSKKKE